MMPCGSDSILIEISGKRRERYPCRPCTGSPSGQRGDRRPCQRTRSPPGQRGYRCPCTGSPPGQRGDRRPCLYTLSPKNLLRAPPSLRDAVHRPDACVSFRAIRGYRPGDYFRRGLSLGGDARVGSVANVTATIRAADGYAWRPASCADVPRINACSRLCPPEEKPTVKKTNTEKTSSEKSSRHKRRRSKSDSSSEEESERVHQEPEKCVCTTQVETKTFTSDAFTMTERRSRDQGTVVDLQTSSKAVDATLVMRDVTTDTDDEFVDFADRHSIQFSQLDTIFN